MGLEGEREEREGVKASRREGVDGAPIAGGGGLEGEREVDVRWEVLRSGWGSGGWEWEEWEWGVLARLDVTAKELLRVGNLGTGGR